MGLAVATEITAIVSLVKHDKPDSSNASLIISASALVIMIFIWLPKRYLARALDSSAMKGEAACSRACILITGVLFIGSLIYRLWSNGWWVDSATSLVLGLLFGRDGVEMLQWARDPDFNGGCCGSCANTKIEHDAELGEQYRDICSCCSEKEECKNADSCQCDMNSIAHSDGVRTLIYGVSDIYSYYFIQDKCCKSISEQTNVCCTREFIKKQKVVTDSVSQLSFLLFTQLTLSLSRIRTHAAVIRDRIRHRRLPPRIFAQTAVTIAANLVAQRRYRQ